MRTNSRRKKRKVRTSIKLLGLVLMLVVASFGFKEIADLVTDYTSNKEQLEIRDSILENSEQYPAELVSLVEDNHETSEFVKGYPDRHEYIGMPFTYTVTQGTMPHLLQWDKRWGYDTYGDGILGLTGCAPTCLAMVSAYLTGDESNTPLAIAQMSERNGYYVNGVGSSWDLMTTGCEPLGIYATELSLDEQQIIDSLESGNPIICSVGPGDFTKAGHFIVLYGIDNNGDILVNDPNSNERTRAWEFSNIQYQIRGIWSYATLY